MASQESVAELLARSLDYREAKNAELSLKQLDQVPNFPLVLLQVVANTSIPLDTRLAGSLFFKNLIKRKWTDADGNYMLAEQDVVAIKSNILDLMISSPPQPRKQLGEAISVIANSDFPDKWPDLVPNLVLKLDMAQPDSNNTVLSVAHTIFERWRHLSRSDALFLEIKLVLEQFAPSYLTLMIEADSQIKTSKSIKWVETMDLLVKIFYDLNCQDLPEFFEDHMDEFMNLLLHYMSVGITFDNEDDDDETAGPLELLKTDICEALTLYTQRYEEEFAKYMPKFVEASWSLLMNTGLQPKNDLIINRCLSFLTAVAKFERNIHMFNSEQTLIQIIEGIIIPNIELRESDLELFEDEPLEFVRKDLEGSHSDTRRQAATEFLRELAGKLEGEVTRLVMRYVNQFLQMYAQQPDQAWIKKSTAVSLFRAIAAKGQITSAGVSTTNLLVDIVDFFNKNMAPELTSSANIPVMKVDAIKFILSFRNQLSKPQLSSAIPMLAGLLNKNQHEAVYTYSSITLERILALKDPVTKKPMFGEQDIQTQVREMSLYTLQVVASGSTKPEELASNEFLMRFLMRILVMGGNGTKHVAHILVPQLVQIIQAVSRNPSNPRFNHYLFECLGACLKHYHKYESVEGTVVQPLFSILGDDVTEFVPYVLQILTLILVLQPTEVGLPDSYQMLLKPILSPQLWEARGNVPALVGLLDVIIQRGPSLVLEMQLLVPLLGVFQSLLASRVREKYAFELLESILLNFPLQSLAQYLGQIAKLLLVKLNNGSNMPEQYMILISRFVFFVAASTEPLGPDFIIQLFDSTEANAFGSLFSSVVLPKSLQIHGSYYRKIAAIGLTRLLCGTTHFTSGNYSALWQDGISKLVGLLTREIADPAQEETVADIDISELSFGSSFSPLMTTKIKKPDPVAYIEISADQYFVKEFKKLAQQPNIQEKLNSAFNPIERQYLLTALNS